MTAFRQTALGEPESTEDTLSEGDWIKLKNLVEESNFWNLPECHDIGGLDGWEWRIEGQDSERYHSSSCWAPRAGAFYCLGSLLVELSGLVLPHDAP